MGKSEIQTFEGPQINSCIPCLTEDGHFFAVGVAARKIGPLDSEKLLLDYASISIQRKKHSPDILDLSSDRIVTMLDEEFERSHPRGGADRLMTAAAYIGKHCLLREHNDGVLTRVGTERNELIGTIVVLDPHQRIVRVQEPPSAHAAPDGELLIPDESPDIVFPFSPPGNRLPIIATAQSCRGGRMARLIIGIQREGTDVVVREAAPHSALLPDEPL